MVRRAAAGACLWLRGWGRQRLSRAGGVLNAGWTLVGLLRLRRNSGDDPGLGRAGSVLNARLILFGLLLPGELLRVGFLLLLFAPGLSLLLLQELLILLALLHLLGCGWRSGLR
jgi:hypothetical protein